MRIALGGIGHESNTFSPLPTSIEDFNVIKGDELLKDGVARFLIDKGVKVTPTIHAWALPSGVVSRSTFLHLEGEMLKALEDAGKIDGVCLLLHGAMEVEEVGSGETHLLKCVREIVSWKTVVSIALDLHGNLNPEIVEYADILTAYRTAPHVDAYETALKAAKLLLRSIKTSIKPTTIIVKPPVLLPGEYVVTSIEPAASIYRSLEEIDRKTGVVDSSMLVGMAWADTPQASASAIVVSNGKRESEAYEAACRLAKAYWDKRREFRLEVEAGEIDEVIGIAKASTKKPVFISDSGDNVTAGAPGDVPIFIEHLLDLKVEDAVVAGIYDPDAVRSCREAGLGGDVKTSIGGKIDKINGYPVEVKGRVVNLTDDGAVLRVDGVDILLTGRRRGWTSIDDFKEFKVNPAEKKIVVVKLGYLTPDFRRIAKLALMALSPGCTNLIIEKLRYERVRRPLYPLDKDFSWSPL
ncbi:MAG: M81 family metallopeptidase [Candidatus Bathyarchaeia archaeon]